MVAPPPPARPTPWALIIAILAVAACVIGTFMAAGVYLGYRYVSSDPPARQGFGHPEVLERLDGAWFRVHFREVPVTLELPAMPYTEKRLFGQGDRALYESWFYYQMQGSLANYSFDGIYYRKPELADPKAELEALADINPRYYAEHYKNYRSAIAERKVQDLVGWELKGTFIRYNQPWVSRAFSFRHGNGVLTLQSEYPAEYRANDQYERILKSLKLGPK